MSSEQHYIVNGRTIRFEQAQVVQTERRHHQAVMLNQFRNAWCDCFTMADFHFYAAEQNSDEAMAVSIEGASVPKPFLICTAGNQLYVLHWQHPAFLVQVVQTIPHTLRFVATYGTTPEQLRELPVMMELEVFVKKVMKKALEGN